MTMVREVVGRVGWIVAASAAGALVFVAVQLAAGFPQHIAEFMGAQIVRQGGYSESLRGVIGWGVHLGVAVSYATLFAVLVSLPFLPRTRAHRWAVGVGVALLLGVASTLITAPAISVTISLLAGRGFPDTLPGLNTGWGLVFWNHLGFFLIAFALVVAVPDLLASRREDRAGRVETPEDRGRRATA